MIEGLGTKSQKTVTCIEIMSVNSNHFILAGDLEGGLTIIRVVGPNFTSYYRGIFNDRKSAIKKILVLENGMFVTVGAEGTLKYWVLQ